MKPSVLVPLLERTLSSTHLPFPYSNACLPHAPHLQLSHTPLILQLLGRWSPGRRGSPDCISQDKEVVTRAVRVLRCKI